MTRRIPRNTWSASSFEKERAHPGLLRSTVLKVAHHGSETSSTLPFMKAVSPDAIVVSSGRKDFGHGDTSVFFPDATVIERYRKQQPKLIVLRTDEKDAREHRDTTDDADGDDVYMYTDGETLRMYRAVGPSKPRRWQLAGTLRAKTEEP